MKHFLFLLLLLASSAVYPQDREPEILVQNRIMATVNGKAISIIDVMKQMELSLASADPEAVKSNVARYQFFTQNWRQTLSHLIDNELIIADAEKLQIKIADAEIREVLHERFGPNVMSTLDALDLTFDDAWHLIYSEMAVQRVSGFRVYANALHRIGPQAIKDAYKNYLMQNPPKEQWIYRVLSIRATTEAVGKMFAQKAYALIHNESLPFEELAAQIKETYGNTSDVTISISDEYNVEGSKLSQANKALLCNLTPDSYSQPIPQISRRDNSTVHRIFYLKNHTATLPPTFDDLADKLQDQLVYKEINKDLPVYLAKLRKHFNFDTQGLESISADFQPFLLQ